MKISVIVVTYNQEATIARTIESILDQDVEDDFEIIIGDDASTDATGEICRRYRDLFPDRIVYIRQPHNVGVVKNYFDCLRQARGEFIADCAGDDYWVHTEKLRMQLDLLVQNPEISMVVTDWLCHDADTGNIYRHPDNPPVTEMEIYQPGQLLVPILSGSKILHLCSAMYRKEIIQRQLMCYPDTYTNPFYTCEDQQILLTMANEGVVVVLDMVSLHYTVRSESISHPSQAADRFNYSLKAFSQSLRLAEHFSIVHPDVNKYRHRMVNHLAAMAFRAGPAKSPSDPRCRVDTLKRMIRRQFLQVPLKARVYLSVMKCVPLWNFINFLRR